jgi:Rieske Fe-S protein
VRCQRIVVATHVPIVGKTALLKATLLQTKLALFSTYAIGATLKRGALPHACYFDTAEPYHYLRVEPRGRQDYAILGGQDHKTGQKRGTRTCFAALEKLMRAMVSDALVDARWSGQVVETHDRLPYIGEHSEGQFIATGFCGNGITFGTLAGMMIRDAITGQKNPWRELFDPKRKNIRSGAWNYLRENADYPYYLAKDWLKRSEGKSVRSVSRGEGRIIRIHGERTAVHRDDDGRLSRVSPVCTHMGCLVNWNSAEKTWDCPCHGSRFRPTGEVIAGPAETPLPPRQKKRG